MNGEYNKFIVSRGKIIDTSTPAVMAIINITPDSFYAGSRKQEEEEIVRSVRKALNDGAAIIDLGAYSTRPGADTVSPDEEMRRMRLALTAVRSAFPDTTVSIDTYRACVAEMAVGEFGADIINDISAGTLDEAMFPTMARLQVPYIMMHMRGTPQTMQQMTQYDDLIPDILRFFAERTERLRSAGFDREIIIDPGFGFAKTTEQNFELLDNLSVFQCFKAPILVGISRKTMIWKTLGITPDEALNGTTALNCFALDRGADILRVHDVKEAVEAVRLFSALHKR